MLSEAERVGYLGVEMIRNYLFSLARRSAWLPLGQVYCPRDIMKEMGRQWPCDLYALPAEPVLCPGSMPAAIARVNARYFATDATGLTNRTGIWCLSDDGLKLPVLHPITHTDFYEFFPNAADAKAWLNSPWHRCYSRIIVIPQEQEADKGA